MKKNKSTKLGIVIAVLLLAIGFAAVTTTLYINGTAKIVPGTFDGDVVFKTAEMDTDETQAGMQDTGTTAVISEDGKEITFTTQTFNTIGDYAVLHYTIENKSQYDAVLGNISCEALEGHETNYSTYLTVTPSTNLDGTTLASKTTSGDATVKVEMKRSFVGEENETSRTISYKCTITATAAETSN